MSTMTVEREAGRVAATRAEPGPIPMTRIVGVELRKMFDTRSGFWLMASIVIMSVLATAAIIVFAPDDDVEGQVKRCCRDRHFARRDGLAAGA